MQIEIDVYCFKSIIWLHRTRCRGNDNPAPRSPSVQSLISVLSVRAGLEPSPRSGEVPWVLFLGPDEPTLFGSH